MVTGFTATPLDFGGYVESGGLMAFVGAFRLAATMADRILKGANPAELPVQFSAKFDFVVNL